MQSLETRPRDRWRGEPDRTTPRRVDGEVDRGVQKHGIDVVAFVDARPFEGQVVEFGREAHEPVVQGLDAGAKLVFLALVLAGLVVEDDDGRGVVVVVPEGAHGDGEGFDL